MDRLTPQQRHYNMAAIQGRDTKPEMVVRKWLWGNGFRYRLNHKRLPGKPDIVLLKYRTCIFVNGCFWHGHKLAETPSESLEFSVESLESVKSGELKVKGEKFRVESSECCKIPKSNTEFWVDKICRNKERDIEVQKQLAAMGWHCITIWECELKPKVREKTLESLGYTLNKIFLQDHRVMHYELPEEEPMMAAEEEDV